MESVLERITKNHFHKFAGGIHPPEQKFLTNDKPIKTIALAKQLILPLKQHIGKSGDLMVKVGDRVLKGQQLTENGNPMSVPIHAPTSGIISDIKPSVIAHASGMSDLCLFLTPDGEDKWRKRNIVEDFKQLSKVEIIDKISYAGIAGMGGAGFPTNIKVNVKPGIKTLIINAAECEPYITADDLLIRERSSAIVNGIDILDYLLEPEFILIGIEDNKPLAIEALKTATKSHPHVHVCVLPTKYPTGGEKQLIKALTGKEVPSGVLPLSLGIVMQNVATVFAISEAIINDTPLIRRVVTVTGQALKKPQNLWVPLGTPVEHLLHQCGFTQNQHQRIIMGGPLMGFTLPSLEVPVVKITNCILAPTQAEISSASKELECIRCGQCAEVCPSSLLPQELQWYAKSKDYDKLEELNLFDCIDCGACAYVCPSQIPLVQYYRVAKAEIRQNKIQEVKSERAKVRFEARKIRLEKDKIAREEKHKKAIEARKSATSPVQAKANNSAVAAALARVKAKKAAQQSGSESSVQSEPKNDVKSMAAQAIARAKAKKAANALDANAQNTLAEPIEKAVSNESVETSKLVQSTDNKKSRTAAAIAKAKAKKLAAQSKQNEQTNIKKTSEIENEDVKSIENSAIENTNNLKPSFTELIKSEPTAAQVKKARTAAAIAKAKAKKQQSKDTVPSQEQVQLNVELSIDLEESIEDFINKEPTVKELEKAGEKFAEQEHTSKQLALLNTDDSSKTVKNLNSDAPVAAEAAVKTTAKPAAKTATKTTAKPAAKPAAKTTAKPAAKTTTKTTAKPASKTTAKPAAKTTTKTTAKPAAKTTTKTTAKPAAKTTTKTTAKPAAKTTTKTTTKPASKTTAKPAAKTTTKTTAKPAAKNTAKPASKTAAKPAAKLAAKNTADTETNIAAITSDTLPVNASADKAVDIDNNSETKNKRIANVIAKAKAQKNSNDEQPSSIDEMSAQDKKAKISAAIAKAKAKKQQLKESK